MDGDIVALHLQSAHLVQRHTHHLLGCFQRQHLGVFVQPLHHAVEHCKQFFLLHRLHQVVQRCHLIPFGDVVGIAGDKDNLHQLVGAAHLLCQTDAVHLSHLNIQQQQVKIRLWTGEQKLLCAAKFGHLHLISPLLRPMCGQLPHILSVLLPVVTDCNSVVHLFPLFHPVLPVYYSKFEQKNKASS